jgi:ribonuclease E
MLINVSEGEECRIALLENGRLDELYMERSSSTSHVGNIYRGRVANVEPSIQAAFIDFGMGRNGFLHISDLMPSYFGRRGDEIVETVGRKMSRRDRPPIQRCLRRGDDIIVQIIKEGIGTKGPTLSTYLSIPGRILVMMPGMGKMGVSKKIEDETERRRLRQILDSLKPLKDCGFIIRTAGIGKTKAEIERDLKYLTRLWEQVEKKQQSGSGPLELYTEGDLVTRTVRDVFSTDIDGIVVDSKDVARRVKDVIKLSSPRTRNRVEVYEDPIPLFHKYNIEREIEQIYSRHVPLPSGGSLVIDSTEALVAIDVNSGRFRDHSDAEMTAFKTDMEAADEIPRQLRLRDLGGVIICDFIDLRFERHRRELEQRLHDNLKNDRAKTKVLRMSQFGIIEMTRQRMRPSLKRSIYFDCPHCKGAGLVKTPESMSLDVMRRLAIAVSDQRVVRVEMAISPDVGMYLLNKKRAALAQLEAGSRKKIIVRQDVALALDEMRLDLYDGRDGLVILEELGMSASTPGHVTQLGTRGGQPQRGRDRRGGRGGGRFDQRRSEQAPRRQPPTQDRQETSAEDRGDMDEAEEAMAESSEAQGHPREDERYEPDQGESVRAQLEGEPGDEADDLGDVAVRDGAQRGGSELGERPEGEWDRFGRGGVGDEGGQHRRRRRRRRGRGGRGGGPAGDAAGQQHMAPRLGGPGEPSRDADEMEQDDADARDEAPAEDDRAMVRDDQRQPAPTHGAEQGGPIDGPPRRRRRRRGGRRHRRRRAGAVNGLETNGGQAPVLGDEPAGGAPEPGIAAEEIVESEPAEPMADAPEDSDTQAGPPKRSRSRRGRGGRSRGRSGQTPETALKAPALPPVVKTGSTDKHLVVDEPAEVEDEPVDLPVPRPIVRPSSHRDLDAIPDDFD